MNYKHLIVITLSLTLLTIAAIVGSSFLYTPQQVESSGYDTVSMTGHMWSSNTGWISLEGNATNADNDPYQLIMQMQENGDGVYTTGSASTNDPGRYGWAGLDHLGWLDFSPDDSNNGNLQQTDPPGGDFRYTSGGGDQEGYFEGSAQFVAGKEDDDGWDGWLKFDGSDYQVKRDYCDFTGHAWGDLSVGWVKAQGTAQNGDPYGMKIDETSCRKPEIDTSSLKINGQTLENGDACKSGKNPCTIDITADFSLSWQYASGSILPEDTANIIIAMKNQNDKSDPNDDTLLDTQVSGGDNPVGPTTTFSTSGEVKYEYEPDDLPDLDPSNPNNYKGVYFEITAVNKFGDKTILDTQDINDNMNFAGNLIVECTVVERDGLYDQSGTDINQYQKVDGAVTTDKNNLLDLRISLVNAYKNDVYRMTNIEASEAPSENITYAGEGTYESDYTNNPKNKDNPTNGANDVDNEKDDEMITYHPQGGGKLDNPDYGIRYEGSSESNSIILHDVRVGTEGDLNTISNYIGKLGLEITVENTENFTNSRTGTCPEIINFGQRNFDQGN